MTHLRHHPSDVTLFEYGAGALSQAARVLVEQHTRDCRPCVNLTKLAEDVGVLLLADMPPLDSPHSMGGAEALIARPKAPSPPPKCPLDLRPVGMRWTGILPVVQFRPIWQDNNDALSLVRMAPGAKVAMHRHDGVELMLVLEGSFDDGRGPYERGDVCETDPDVEHEPRTIGDTPCVCLVAMEGKRHYRSPIQRLRQRIYGF